MKVLLRANVPHLGTIGEVVEVNPGYARNYLLPQLLAMEPTTGNLKKIEVEKKVYLEKLAKLKAEIEARAKVVDGKEITMAARANVEGHLYGSVGPAQIVEALAKENLHVEEANIALDEPIRRLDKYEVQLRFGEGVTAKVIVWVVPLQDGTTPEELSSAEGGQAPAEAPAEDESDVG